MAKENGTMRAPANSDPRLSAVGNEPLAAFERGAFNPAVQYGGPARRQPMHGHAEEVVVGGIDGRKVVPGSRFPYNCIAQLECHWSNGAIGPGTGFFISPTCVITAGHCVSPQHATWVARVEVVPGMTRWEDGSITAPFGRASSTRFRTVEGWFFDRNDDFDFGAVILPDRSLFDRVGEHLGFQAYSAAAHGPIEVAGYPKDRGFRFCAAEGHVLNATEHQLRHSADTGAGQSGAPVYDRNTYKVIGVHTGGHMAGQYNTAIKLMAEVAKHWYDWTRLEGQQ